MTVGNDKPVYRCDRSLEAGVLMDSPLPPSPVGRLRGVAPERGLVLCNVCQSQQDSWPWWAESGLKVDAVGPENDRLMRDAVMGADMVVVAWGDTNRNRLFRERAQRVTDFLRSLDKQIHCLGKISYRSPKHPARGTNRLQPWP